MGFLAEASGFASTAMGFGTLASALNSTVLGACNDDGGGDSTYWNELDPLFVVGNGEPSNTNCPNPSNALVILKNGNVGIGENAPEVPLHLRGGSDVDASGGGYLVTGSPSGTHMRVDDNELQAFTGSDPSILFVNREGGIVRVGASSIGTDLQVFGNVYVNGSEVHASDIRLKRDITSLDYGLDAVAHLRPVSYLWKDRDNSQRSVGLIAQELQQVIPELVHVQDDEQGTLTVDYNGVTIVLLGAVQELEAQVPRSSAGLAMKSGGGGVCFTYTPRRGSTLASSALSGKPPSQRFARALTS